METWLTSYGATRRTTLDSDSKGVGNKEKYQGSYSGKDDSKKDSEYMDFLDKSMEVAKLVSKKDAHLFYWCDSSYIGMVQALYVKHKVNAKRVCLWLKNNQNPTPKIAFNKVYEPCVWHGRQAISQHRHEQCQ